MGQAEIINIYNVYWETNPLVIKILQKEENNLVQYCHAALKNLHQYQMNLLNIMRVYNFNSVVHWILFSMLAL